MKIASFQISEDIIKSALLLPDNTKIHNIVRDDYEPCKFTIYVEHPDFPEMPEGAKPTEICPIYKKTEFDWGL